MSWKDCKLGEFISIKHGWAFKGEYFSNEGDYLLLTPGNAYEQGGLKLRPNKDKFYLGEFPSEFLLKKDDIVVIMTDLVQTAPLLGGAIRIPQDNYFLHNQRLGLVEIKNNNLISKNLLYYLLNSPSYRAQVRGSATGATVRHTAPQRIYDCKVLIPNNIEEQDAIASILLQYDVLIEINRKRIALLEESARLLYQEWFVKFRFPNVKIGRDGLPDGWTYQPLSQLIEINPKVIFEKERIYPFVPMQSLSESSMLIDNIEMRKISGGAKFQNFDTLLARITPCLENGKTGFVQFLDEENPVASGSTEFIVMRSKKVNPYWVYCLARDNSFRDHVIASMVGSDGRQRVNQKSFDSYFVLQPTKNILNKFEETVATMFEQIQILSTSIDKLQKARDELLPKLISGQIKV